MPKNSRIYKAKDVEVLIVSETIAINAIKLEADIIVHRPQWAEPYFSDFIDEIHAVYSSALGVDNAKELREATIAIYGLMNPASKALLMFKTQLEIDFYKNKTRGNEILTQLGFSEHYKAVQRKDQEAFVELLTKFKVNMTPALQAELNAAGIHNSVITNVTDYFATLKAANISQETAKGVRKKISSEAVKAINEIYRKAIAVSKIAAVAFDTELSKRDRLNFSKNLKQLNSQKHNTPPPTSS